ncbi:DUF3014 domain-containing protein [Psychromonas sp. GE-S-Ul-11]|uniref:DUF3014 domain-containing protein n=1 Tax=Psychromonas sp. GE-S-Ul-11 TaxID=3241170 RepID=UPI00390CCBEE
MPYPDFPKEKSYSWLNILLIVICVSIFGYSIFYFTYPDQHHRLVERLELSSLFNNNQQVSNEDKTTVITQPTESDTSMTKNVGAPLVSSAEPTIIAPVDPDLPTLMESDPDVLLSIEEFSKPSLMNNKMLQKGIISSTVVFIDNFSRGDFIASFSPLLPPKLPFVIDREAGQAILSQQSYQRYDKYAAYIDSLDVKKLIKAYHTFKPLIDESYHEIARPGSEFHDVLNNAIDVALSVPVIEEPITLHSPSVMYLFDDPTLEDLNDAQKLLLRFGPDNLITIQNKLAEIQLELNNPESTSESTDASSSL